MQRRNRITAEQLGLIQLAVFVHSLEFFFREGTAAAKSATAGFEELGVEGFVVGATYFSGENENVMRGANLAERLSNAIRSLRGFEAVGSDRGITELTIHLWGVLRRGERGMD
ncbi:MULTISPECIES: hypothetical protein [Pirellulaceae]|nr:MULTISPECIES: hypothetical protein [Pirellulaceae]